MKKMITIFFPTTAVEADALFTFSMYDIIA